MSNETNEAQAPFGCLRVIITIIVVWAVLFGVTWNGKHYGLSCSCERGVEFHK